MRDHFLSIIMPVYNGGDFVSDALRSILQQACAQMEIIVIDDGSTDGSADLIRGLFKAYLVSGQLRLLVQENRGVSAARNAGLDVARGSYIGFVDADDVVLPGYVEQALRGMQTGADIIEFGFCMFSGKAQTARFSATAHANRRFGLHRTAHVIDGVYAMARWYPCTRIFRAGLFDGIRFPSKIRFCEDLMTVPALYERSSTVLSLREALYGYRRNPAGATLNVRADYIGNLCRYYESIPRSGLRRHDYLRMAVAYSIQSCRMKFGQNIRLDGVISSDMRRLRYMPSVYRDIPPRRILVQLYPSAFELLWRIHRAAMSVRAKLRLPAALGDRQP